MRHALVMGATGSIGAAICEELAQKGFSLYLHYGENKEKAKNLQKSLEIRYPKQDFFVVSLKMDKLLENDLEIFVKNLFSLDTIVFAQGRSWYGLLKEMPEEKMNELWNVHVKTPVLLIQKLQDKLVQNPFSRIIFVGSIYGKSGSAMEVFYSTLKGALESFVKSYAKEVATLGLTVNLIAPGAIKTGLLKDFTQDELENLTLEIPLLRLGKPEEIAYFVGVCASEKASYLTGSIQYVTGGWLN